MKKTIYFLMIIFLVSIYIMLNSGCMKDEITNTIIRQDTIIVHDTVIVNYSYIEHYNSGNSSELISSLPIQQNNSWNQGGVIFALLIPDLKAGDVVFATVECEVSNNYLYNVAQFSSIIAADNSTYLPDDPGIIEVCETNGGNVTHEMHHWTINQQGTYKCTSNLGDKWINFCAYAKSTSASSGDSLVVEQDYGRLSVIVFRL